MRVLLLAGCSILFAASPALAQAPQFRVGQWGVEAPISGSSGTLLKFNDPNAAWLIGAGLTFQRVEISGGGPASAQENSLISLRLGRRWYQRASGPIRPFTSLGLIGGIGTQSRWQAGVFGEFGASYFLNDRLNLGAVGALSLEHGKSETGGGIELTSTSVSIAGPRILVGFLF